MQSKVGIIIVSFNASLAVRVTLASLRRAKNNVPFEVILIDNASEDNERKTIHSAFDKHVTEGGFKGQFIQLENNLGFAGGNNVGIKKSLEDPGITHVCLLNSDVLVSDHWLDRLVQAGKPIVSPVTNKADSEQCVPVDYTVELSSCLDEETDTIAELCFKTINEFAQKWYKAWQGNLVPSEATFFCVLLTRELIEKIGLLDDFFFPGGYEDDDYCARVLATGIDIFLVRDVFMHHFGSASFGQLQQKYFAEKASRNREYFENKHQVTWKSRYEKPLVSYAQDIIYALKGNGDYALQIYFHKLYCGSISRLLHHIEKEFKDIKRLVDHSGQQVPVELLDNIDQAEDFGNMAKSWDDCLQDINSAIVDTPCALPLLKSIQTQLEALMEAAHAKASCNFKMVSYLRTIPSATRTATGGNQRSSKYLQLLLKGLPFLWKLKGIVFFGGYPYPEREKDGYFQRIRSIDNLVNDKWRIYIDHYTLPGRESWYDRPEPKVLVLHMRNHGHYWFMRLLVKLFVLRCRTVYFHSVLRMEDGKFGSFMRWAGVTKVIDIHGVVPEEFRYHNDFYNGVLYDEHEKLAIKKSDAVIVVSKAMQYYLQNKYRNALNLPKIIVLPIFPNLEIEKHEKPYLQNKPIVVYAGGTHKWQQVPKMIEAIADTKDICIHKFYTPNPSEVIVMLPKNLRRNPNITIDSKPFHELLELYKDCHYGFVLREDIIVNHAACPTKLVEYVAMGIVPIVDCEQMGDFKELGMEFVRLKDFKAGILPDEDTRNQMAMANYGVYKKLQELNYSGKKTLKAKLIAPNKNFISLKATVKKGVLKSRHAVGVILSKNTLVGLMARKVWWRTANLRRTYLSPLIHKAEQKKINWTTAHPCDILIQVENFNMGGLENVVLDQIDALKGAGKNVALLVLGEAGYGVEAATKKNIPIAVMPYSSRHYQTLLKELKPKLVIGHYSSHGAGIIQRQGIPFIQVIHNIYMWFNTKQKYQFSQSVKHTSLFIAVSEFAKTYSVTCLGVPEEKCQVMPNGIDLKTFRNINYEQERYSFRKKYGIRNNEFVFLSVGSITHQKNHIGTVRAFHLALQDCPGAKLIILGKAYEPWLLQEIETYIAEHALQDSVILAGESIYPASYYAMADAYVHCAFFEGGPLTLLEAIEANLPIMITNTGLSPHFSGRQGITIVPTPIDIIKYNGPIGGLRSNPDFEKRVAEEMKRIHQQPECPNFQERFLTMLDKQYAYRQFVTQVSQILEGGQEAPVTGVGSWPESFSHEREKTLANIDLLSETTGLSSIPTTDVLIQVDNFNVGGLENVVLDQLDTFQKEGMSVGLLVLGEPGIGVKRARSGGVPVYITRFDIITYQALLKKANPRVVISHYSIRGAAICQQLGIPFVQVIQNTYMWFSKLQSMQFAEAAKRTALFVAVSEYAKDYSVGRLGVPEDKCVVIPNSIDLKEFRNQDKELERKNLRKAHGIGDNEYVFLSVGSINHQKNHICTVRAFHRAYKDCPNAKLVILGKLYEKDLWKEIEDYIASHQLEEVIIYAGESENPPAYYFMADAFVHSAFFEGGQLSLLEALAANLPIVTTEIGFARHFAGRPGFSTVPPPLEIIDYHGPIWELRSTPECEQAMAAKMVKTYRERIRPDLPEKIVDMFDKSYTYQHYVSMIRQFMRSGTERWTVSTSWPELISVRNGSDTKVSEPSLQIEK